MFILTPVLLVFLDALGFARQDFHADLSVVGIFVAAALTIIGVGVTKPIIDRYLGSKDE